jgi:hypothetical protein
MKIAKQWKGVNYRNGVFARIQISPPSNSASKSANDKKKQGGYVISRLSR